MSSLPFLKYSKDKRADGGVITQHLGEVPEGVKAASDLIKAIESKDEDAVLAAFTRMFKACEKQPHDEAPHESDKA